MASEVVLVAEPPTGPILQAFVWFAGRGDDFAKAGVKSAGAVVGAGVGADLVLKLTDVAHVIIGLIR